ncbi:semaphorin-6D-like [Stigmatopora nigra]
MADPPRAPTPPSLLLFLLASCFLHARSFPQDPIAINVVDDSRDVAGFRSLLRDNDTLRLGLGFQTMRRVNRMLFITARDHVFAVNLSTAADAFVPQMKLTWRSTDVSKCAVRGKNSDECYNYIKVLVARDDETLFVCGTNALDPACRHYKTSTLEQVGSELPGQARCPFESGQSNAATFAGGDLYSATVTDFLASDAVIYRSLGDRRPVLRSVKYDSKWLREPRFLHAIDYGSHVYFFLSEIAIEYTALGKVVFSRVARVCKNDDGGSPRVLDKHWTSFLKARLNCSLPGDSLFYFDVLQSLTDVVQINGRPAVLAIFTTQANSIPGSAVCAFYMDDVEKAFDGKFKEQRGGDASWTAVAERAVPSPRPGSCAGGDGPAADFESSSKFPDETLAFVKSFPLVDEAVLAVNRRPLYTRTSSRSKLTRIAADVSAGPHKERTVVFLGSEDGRVAKVLLATRPDDAWPSRLLEDIRVYDPEKCDPGSEEDRRVLGLELDKEHHALFVAFSSCLLRVPLSRCTRHGACKRSCLASRDPYCIWLRTGTCADMAPGFKAGFEQDIEGDHAHLAACHADLSATARDRVAPVDAAYGVRGTEGDHSSHVHYTLLLACALVAFSLGAVSSGLVVSRFCGGDGDASHHGSFKDAEAPLPRSLSLRSLSKMDSLLDAVPKADKASPETHASFIPDGPAPHSPCARHHLPVSEPPRVSPTQADGEPDSRPEWAVERKQSSERRPGPSTPPAVVPAAHLPGDMSALNELLRHIQQVGAQGGGGIRVLTGKPGGLGHLHQNNKMQGHSSYCQEHFSRALPLNANGTASWQEALPESPTRPPAAIPPRHYSFNRQGVAPRHLLARMNSNGSNNGAPARRQTAAVCLTRQHSYSEGVRRANATNAAAVRRAVSLKPKIPPKPSFLPEASPWPAAGGR